MYAPSHNGPSHTHKLKKGILCGFLNEIIIIWLAVASDVGRTGYRLTKCCAAAGTVSINNVHFPIACSCGNGLPLDEKLRLVVAGHWETALGDEPNILHTII